MGNKALETIAPFIDHTLLKATSTPQDIEQLCAEALNFEFASVCVYPYFVQTCKKILMGSSIRVCTVIGFPHGNHPSETKIFETQWAKKQGADEFDMVINFAALKSKEYKFVEKDIRSVCEANNGLTTKVILETHLLNDEELRIACELTCSAGAHFVKTSTGMTGGGATEEDIQKMRSFVGENFGVKASGGIRSVEKALALLKAGANRIGSSSAAQFLSEDSLSTDKKGTLPK